MSIEKSRALEAVAVIREAGGNVSFDEYDRRMKEKHHGQPRLVPLHWVAGVGQAYSETARANIDKLSVFAACAEGWVVQTVDGYCLAGA